MINNLLPYVAYEHETRIYLNTDETIGFAWKCQTFADHRKTDESASLLSGLELPESSVLQFMVYADPEISFIVSLKLSVNDTIELEAALGFRDQVSETLKELNLKPRPQTPQDFIDFTSKLFTGNDLDIAYNDEKPIKKQCIPAGIQIEINWKELKLNQRVFNCLTPRMIPEEFESDRAAALIKEFFDFSKDQQSLSYIYTLNIVFEKPSQRLETEISKKIKKFAPGLFSNSPTKKEEQLQLKVLPVFGVFSDPLEAERNLSSVKREMDLKEIIAQEEKELLTSLFIGSLPFGIYNINDNFRSMNRGFVLTWEDIIKFLPVYTSNGHEKKNET